MSAKTSLFLSILFFIIAGLAFTEMAYWQPKRNQESVTAQTIVELRDKHFEWVELGVKDRNAILLECKENEACDFSKTNRWEISFPIRAEGNTSKIVAMLAHFKQLDFIREIKLTPELKKGADWSKEFGLNAPEAWVKIKIKEEKHPIRIELGGKSPIGEHFYVTNNHKPKRVFLVRNYFIRVISPGVFHWRDKELFPGIKREEIESFQWKYHKVSKRIEVKKKKDSSWWLSFPHSSPAKQELIQGMLSLVVKSNPVSILSKEEAQKIQPKEKALSFRFSTKTDQKKIYSLNFWDLGKNKEYLIQSSERDWFAKLNKDTYKAFTKKYTEYIQNSLFPPALKVRAQGMEWTFPNKTKLALQREGAEWKLEKESGKNLNQVFHHFWENSFSPTLLRSASPKESFVSKVKKKGKALQVRLYGEDFSQLYKIWLPQKGEILVQQEGSSLYHMLGEKVAKYIPHSPDGWIETQEKK